MSAPSRVRLIAVAAMAAVTFLVGCGTPPSDTGDIADPFEVQNRQQHASNVGVDRFVVRPVSRVWGEAIPQPVRRGALNFAGNLDTPGHVLNDVLQGEVDDAVHNLFRFVINSTVGLAGIFDPASSMGLEPRTSDFGQTLYVWGADEGVFVVMPFFGARTERHAYGTVVDIAMNPSRILLPLDAPSVESAVIQLIDTRYSLGPTIDSVLYESADSYAQSRSIYLQNRRFFLAGGRTEEYFDPYEELYGE